MNVINGPNNGLGLIFGASSGDDTINAFQFGNQIFSAGANDTISTGAGDANVNLGGGALFANLTDVVTLGGQFNTVATSGAGHVGSSITIQGGAGFNNVSLRNTLGTNIIQLLGYQNVINVNGDALNDISPGYGLERVLAGQAGDGDNGHQSIISLRGIDNTVIGGDQDFVISGGRGGDFISLGNGTNTVTESGIKDKITVGAGVNTITDAGSQATIAFSSSPVASDLTETLVLTGTGDSVTGKGGQNFNISVTNGGSGRFIFGDGDNTLTTTGGFNTIVMGTPQNGGDVILADGTGNAITLGDGANNVTANGASSAITLGGGDNTVSASGAGTALKAGNGNNGITANGASETITLGNGDNHIIGNGAQDSINLGNGDNDLTANGDSDVVAIGAGTNKINANGNFATISLGAGTTTLAATGNFDTIGGNSGNFDITIGTRTTLTLSASSVGTSINATDARDTIALSANANASINDSPVGGGLVLDINADATGNAGIVQLTGFGADASALINLHGFAGITNPNQLLASGDGAGGSVIHLGTGVLDLVGATVDPSRFSFV